MQRRDFINTSVRVFLLALLGILSFLTFFNKEKTDQCTTGSLCNACNKSNTCTLPQNAASG